VEETLSLKQVPTGTELPEVSVIGLDGSGWFLIEEISANPFVIFY
jgi:hypothetical protein